MTLLSDAVSDVNVLFLSCILRSLLREGDRVSIGVALQL